MSWRGRFATVALFLVAVACSDSTQESPATAPPTTVATTTAATSTVATAAPTTTLAPSPEEARLAEIEEIFRDLALARLTALFDADEAAYRSLFSVEAYLEESMAVFGAIEFIGAPTQGNFEESVIEVLVDRPDCLAARIHSDRSQVLAGASSNETIKVLTPLSSAEFGYAFAGTGWLCDGPHPLGP